MKTMYDVQQLLKRFGVFVYTGDRLGDLELMQMEITELYETNCMDLKMYHMARLILIQEINNIKRYE